MYTDDNGRATFTVQVGPKSDVGIYNTDLEVRKDSYPTRFEQINFHVISQPEKVNTVLRINNEGVTGGDGAGGNAFGGAVVAAGGFGGSGGDGAGGNAFGGDGGVWWRWSRR